jgi:hypothetical protein
MFVILLRSIYIIELMSAATTDSDSKIKIETTQQVTIALAVARSGCTSSIDAEALLFLDTGGDVFCRTLDFSVTLSWNVECDSARVSLSPYDRGTA